MSQKKQGELLFSEQGYDLTKDERDRETARKIQIYLKTKPEKQLLLDMGCGTGLHGTMLAKKQYRVVGVDISRKMTRLAHACGEQVVQADLEKLPLRLGTISIFYAAYILHHFPDLHPLLREVESTSKNPSEIFIVDPNGNNPVLQLSTFLSNAVFKKLGRFLRAPSESAKQPGKYVKLLNAHGFRNVEVQYPSLRHALTPPSRSMLGLLTFIKRLLFVFVWHLLPEKCGATNMIITASFI